MQHSPEALKPGAVFTVVDAGGSTVDTAMLQVASILPKLELREVKASDCMLSLTLSLSDTFRV